MALALMLLGRYLAISSTRQLFFRISQKKNYFWQHYFKVHLSIYAICTECVGTRVRAVQFVCVQKTNDLKNREHTL